MKEEVKELCLLLVGMATSGFAVWSFFVRQGELYPIGLFIEGGLRDL